MHVPTELVSFPDVMHDGDYLYNRLKVIPRNGTQTLYSMHTYGKLPPQPIAQTLLFFAWGTRLQIDLYRYIPLLFNWCTTAVHKGQ